MCLALGMSTGAFLPSGVYEYFLIVTFSIIVFTTIVQGLTVPKVYQKIQDTLPEKL